LRFVRRLANLSFRWQILLLGALVVILSVSVLFAIFATLHYTKSAVLRQEKDRLLQTARGLAQEYEDRADLDHRSGHPALLDGPDSPTSSEVLSLLGRVVLKDTENTAGGFYIVATDSLSGAFAPDGERIFDNPGIGGESGTRNQILSTARSAASSRVPAEKVLINAPGLVLIEAVPVHDSYSVVGSAWSIRRLSDLPGSNRFRAYLISAALGLTALASVVLTLLVINSLQGGVRKIESSLKTLEGNLTTQIQTAGAPKEIQEIVEAINRLGGALREKIEREKQFENQLRHTERLASLGRLVAGVAHEVRNPLATIRLRVQMCSRESTNPRVKESCAVASMEIERLNGIVNRLLNFARPVQLHLAAVDLRALIQERIESFRELAAHCHVGVVSDFSSALPALCLDRNRMAQVFDNIIQNAVDAMADSGGTLFVSATTPTVNGDEPKQVSVEFRDTGRGMSPVTLSHAFDPFFTTKASGTGLGLSICHELVAAHGGEIHAESELDHGTSVRVNIPVAPSIQAPEQLQANHHEH
jgi:signal transduction histidine kinase